MNTLKELLKRQGPKLGTYVAEFATPGIGHILRSAGCDYVLFGMEHSGFGVETTKTVLRTMEAADLPVIVHVRTCTYADIAQVCDVGAEGIMTPMTSTVEQAQAALDAIKYPPLGKRGCGMPMAYERHTGTMSEQIAAANARTVYVPLIESAEGVENVEAIAALDNVDAIWVGQLDLSISLGIPDQLDHPLFLDAIERIASAGQRHGKTLAILAATVDQASTFYEMGFDMICFSEDTWIYRDALKGALDELSSRLSSSAPDYERS